MNDPISRAIAFAGSQVELARRLSVTPSLVSQWLKRRRPIAAHHCVVIEREAGIRCEELRSDLIWTRDPSGQVTGHHVPVNRIH